VVSPSGSNLVITGDGSPVGSFAYSSVSAIQIVGGPGDDTLRLASNLALPATLKGGGGNDKLVAGAGNSILIGGGGNDILHGGAGSINLLVPGRYDTDNDITGNDTLIGGTGLSIADFSHRTDPLYLSNDNQADSGDFQAGEHLEIMSSVSEIFGGEANDTIVGTIPGEFLSGGAGADSIQGGGATDIIIGGSGTDTVRAAAEPVSLFLADGQADDYSGISTPAEDVLQLDNGLDVEIS